MTPHYRRPVSRPLSTDERRLLLWMLDHGAAEARAYVDQVDRLRVVAECTCGCPTVDLALDDQPELERPGSSIIADAQGQSPDGVRVNVIVHVRNRVISELEVVGFDHQGPFQLPVPEALEPW